MSWDYLPALSIAASYYERVARVCAAWVRQRTPDGLAQSFRTLEAKRILESLPRVGGVFTSTLFGLPMAAYGVEKGEGTVCSDAATYFMAGLIACLSILSAVLARQNYRYAKSVANVKRQHAEVAHVGRLALVGEITASVTHEVTQPLSAILSNVETAELLLQRPMPSFELLQEILADIRKDDMRAYDIVRKLRPLLHKRELQLEDVDINGLVGSVLTLVRADAVRRNIEIRAKLDPGRPQAQADPVHLQQVLLNLIMNGMDAMADTPADRRRLEVRTARRDHLVEVAVIDHGTGIKKGDMGKLFEPFFTTKASGLGLGLSISKSIIDMHGGSIWAESHATGGSIFRFTVRPSKASTAEGSDAGGELRDLHRIIRSP